MMRRQIVHLVLALSMLALISQASGQDNWPQWRGPDQNGVGKAANLPEKWSETENIVWKTPLPSWSGGSPVIWGDRVFVTSPSKARGQADADRPTIGRRGARNPGGSELLLICISKRDGTVLWERELDTGNRLRRKQNDSSPSPVTDGNHVWAVTGTGAVAAFDMDGTRIWKRNLQSDYGNFGLMFGYASSPLYHDGLLILQILHGYTTDDDSYLVAFDALTGTERWREIRQTDAISESPDAYTSPTLSRHAGETQIVVAGGDYVTGHDPETGKEIWRAAGLNPRKLRNYRIIASPVAVDGMIYAPTRLKPLLALRAGGVGDVTTSNLVWKWDKPGGPDVPTPACDGKYFYMLDDRGSIVCLNAKTGEVVWGPERTARGTVSASPTVADDKVYLTNEDGVTTVLAAGPEFKLLATNELDAEYTLSSLAVSRSRLFLRTDTHLYCIGK